VKSRVEITVCSICVRRPLLCHLSFQCCPGAFSDKNLDSMFECRITSCVAWCNVSLRESRHPYSQPEHTHTHAHARTHTRSCGSYNFDSHTAERMACPNVSVCVDGPSGISDTIGFAWNEGDVETAPGNYDIPLWVLLPKRAESTNLLVVASPSASHIGMST
jgi:hypothetical protein